MKIDPGRRLLLRRASATGLVALSGAVAGQPAYPHRPIRVLVPFAPGTATDLVFRALAAEAGPRLGQPLVIENRTGAAGVPAYLAMKSAAPDGYTLGGVNVALWRQPVLEDVPYDPLRDFTYIMNLAETQFGVVVAADGPFKTWSELLAHGRANPGSVNFGVAAGLRQSAHMFMLEVMAEEKVSWQAIGFGAGPGGVNELIGGRLTFSVEAVGTASALARAGKVRFLAVATDRRLKSLPDVPTMRELGYSLSIDSPMGLGAPAGVAAPVVQAIHDAFKHALETPQVIGVLETLNQAARYLGTADFNRLVVRSVTEQRELLAKYGFAKKR